MKLAIGSNVYEGVTAPDVCVAMEAMSAERNASNSQFKMDYDRGCRQDALNASIFASDIADRLACFDERFARVSAVQSPPSHVWEFSDCEPLCKTIIASYHEEACQAFLDVIVDVGWGRWVADEGKA